MDAIQKAYAIVLASPVYFYSVSAQLKLALGRTTALTVVEMPVKQSALPMTCMDRASAEPAIAVYKATLSFKKWEDFGVIIAPGLSDMICIDGFEELEQV